MAAKKREPVDELRETIHDAQAALAKGDVGAASRLLRRIERTVLPRLMSATARGRSPRQRQSFGPKLNVERADTLSPTDDFGPGGKNIEFGPGGKL